MTLDDTVTFITLPDALEWVDEYQWAGVEQDVQRMVGGGMIVSEAAVLSGRPITLVSGESVWVTKTVLDQIQTFANTAGKVMNLTLPDARTFIVMFDREKTALEAKPVWRQNVQDPGNFYIVTINLMEV